MTIDTDQPRPGTPRLLYWSLVASLAVNLLFVGLFATAAWEREHEPRREGQPGLLGFVHELPADRQDAVRRDILAARESVKEQRVEVRKAWVDTNALMAAEPFDAEKFKTALKNLSDLEAKYKAALNNALVDTAQKLTPDERKLLQSWRERRHMRLLAKLGEQPKEGSKGD